MSHPDLQPAIAWLKRNGTKAHRDGLARFAIPTERALGVTMGSIQRLAKQLGHDHALAQALWDSEWLEARMLAAYMALRATGKRNATLHKASLAVSQRLAASEDAAARWVGKDALRELNSASVLRRISMKRRP